MNKISLKCTDNTKNQNGIIAKHNYVVKLMHVRSIQKNWKFKEIYERLLVRSSYMNNLQYKFWLISFVI